MQAQLVLEDSSGRLTRDSQLHTLNSSAPAPLASLSYTLNSVNLTDGQLTGSGLATVGGRLVYRWRVQLHPSGRWHDHWRIDSVRGQTPSGDTLSLDINVNRTVTISQLLPGHAASHTFVQLLVNASGLVLAGSNETGDYYELASCDDMLSANNLTIYWGDIVILIPADYIYRNVCRHTHAFLSHNTLTTDLFG